MKNYCSSSFRSPFFSTVAVICAVAVNALAQTNLPLPVVSVRAGDLSASESGVPSRFTLFRDGPTNLELNVYCVLDGTASNGVDYALIPNWIPIPAGVREVPIPVRPMDDPLVEGTETVNLHLVYSPLLPPINYVIGAASNATVYILDNDPPPTNLPPTINIASPANGEVFLASANILVLAGVQDPDGNAAAATVEFFAGDHKIGNGQLTDPGPLHAAAFRFYWTNVPVGDYELWGKVTDEQGASGVSAPVHVSVRANSPTNQPPSVSIAGPPNGATFPAESDILICAAAEDRDGYVATVEFFAGEHSLGVRTNLCPQCVCGALNLFCLMWNNVPPGSYVLRARATDNSGAASLSDPIQISVLPSPPRLPLVTIWATDPNATEPCPTTNTPPPLDTARFTVRRDSGTNVPFVVHYRIGGTASNGVDYVALSGAVEIPAGRFEADILVSPLADGLAEGPESVVLNLQPVPCVTLNPPPPECYGIGSPSEAAAVIRDCEHLTNAPPYVYLTAPPNGATFPAPADILVCAAANDRDGYVATVEFFAGDHSLGIRSNLCPLCAGGPANPFCLVWTNVPPGGYVLRAKATDNLGASSLSEPVQITVGQEPPHLPVVTLWPTDPNATEPCLSSNSPPLLNPGRFTVRRDSGTNVPFVIYYSIGGTASNGVDYATLSGSVEIPAGRFDADIVINPLSDSVLEGAETVVLRLQPIACIAIFPPPPDCYQIGVPNEASVYIRDCEHMTNAPPYVRLDSPQDGAVFPTSANVRLAAYAQDPEDGFAVTVEFFSGTNSLGFGTFVGTRCETYCPYFALTWSNVPPGSYTLTAKATDQNGASAISQLAQIRVGEPQPTNAPPKVFITAPTNGAVFVAPVNIPIVTDTMDVDGYVWRVEFFANDHKIGEDSKLFLVAPPDGSHIGYEMVWSNPPPGLYALRAKAYDAAGASAFSEPVRISVIGTNPLPPTNFLPIVTITAIDPIAAEGTNCWRWYTNIIGWNDGLRTNYSGTNTAVFLVRRSGSTNASLTVYYGIRGSASNGVDYARLPGVVTIPAGERSARITVVPPDDALLECTETVILGLLVSSNSPPDYLVGWPGRAAAIIVDNDQPPPGTRRLCDGIFHWSLPAPNGFHYRIECSLDLIHWVPVSSNTVTDFDIRFAEPETEDFPSRFYRVVPESAPPLE